MSLARGLRVRDKIQSGLLRAFAWLVLLFVLTPLIIISAMAFTNGEFLVFPPEGFSIRWFGELTNWIGAIQNSVLIAIPAALIATTIGGTAAYSLDRYDYQFGKALAAVATLPITLPPVIVGVMFMTFFITIGNAGNIWNLVIAHSIFLTPFPFILISQGLGELDRGFEEAARNLGASQLLTVRTITFPLIRANVIAGFLFAFILSLNEYIIAWLLSGFAIQTVPIQIFTSLRYNYSPTIAVISLLFIIVTFAALTVADYLAGGLWE
jgi:ABC-type spermidine/putrescine transport system, permease component II